MPAIPQYEQRTQASTGGGVGVPNDPAAVSRGFDAVGAALKQFAEDRRRVEEEDAAIWVTEKLSVAQSHWNEQLQARKDSAEAGAPEFTAKILADHDTYSRDLVAKAPTKRAQMFLRHQLDSDRSQILNSASSFEATARAEHAERVVGAATDLKRQVLQVAPERFDTMLGEQLELIGVMRAPEQLKERMRRDTREIFARDAVIGLIDRAPTATLKALNTEPGASGIAAIESLNADDRLTLRNQAEVEINRREADQRARNQQAQIALNDSRNDALAAKAAGLPAQLPSRSLYIAVDPKEGAKRYQLDSQLLSTYDAVDAAVMLPPAEGAAQLAAFKPTQQEGAADQAKVQQHATQLYQHHRKQFEEDPVTMIVRQDQETMELLTTIGTGQATPEQVDQYVNRVRSKQEAAGLISTKLLPANYADAMTEQLAFNPERPGARPQTMQALRQQWGRSFPQVIREIAPKLEGDARVMVAMRPEVAKQYDQALAASEKTKTIVPSNSQRDLNKKIVEELEGLAESLIYSDDGPVRLAENQAAVQVLAMSYVSRGTTPAAAAQKAADVVVNERYRYRDTLRIPRSLDADDVQDGAQGMQFNLTADKLFVQPLPGDSLPTAQNELLFFIKREGYWVTTSDESGAELRIPYQGGSAPVTRTDGTRIRFTWAELAAFEGREVPEYIRRGQVK